MPQPHDPARIPSAAKQTKKTAAPARRPRPPQGPVAAREWDVAHAAALRVLLTQPPAVLPNQVGPVTAKVCVLARALRNTRFVKSAAPDPQQNQALRPSFPRAPGSEVSRDTTDAGAPSGHNSTQALMNLTFMADGHFAHVRGHWAYLPASLVTSRRTASGVWSMSPRKRTSPWRPSSARATEIVILEVSRPTKAALSCCMARPLCVRLGTGPSGATLVRRIARDEPPPLQQRTYGLPGIVAEDHGVGQEAESVWPYFVGLRSPTLPYSPLLREAERQANYDHIGGALLAFRSGGHRHVSCFARPGPRMRAVIFSICGQCMRALHGTQHSPSMRARRVSRRGARRRGVGERSALRREDRGPCTKRLPSLSHPPHP